MHELEKRDKKIKGGFIHIPFLPEQASNYPGQPSMSLSTIRKGIELAVEVTTTVEVDIVEIGGLDALSRMNCTTPPVNNWYNKYSNIHRGDFCATI